MTELGVDVPVDYAVDDPVEVAREDSGGKGVDAVLDTAGGNLVARSVRATRVSGRLASVVSLQGDLTPAYERNQTIHGVAEEVGASRWRLEQLAALVERGHVRPLIDGVLDLGDVAVARKRLRSGHGRGKIVLRVERES